jgi:hypothetical protein
VLATSLAAPAHADAGDAAQRALVQRQQQSDDFALRLRQSQQTLNPGSFAREQSVERLNLEQRKRLQNLNDQQVLQLQSAEQNAASSGGRETVQSGYQQQRFEQERLLQLQNFERQQRQLQPEQASPRK